MRTTTTIIMTCVSFASIVIAAEQTALGTDNGGLALDANSLHQAKLTVAWNMKLPLSISERIEKVTLLDEHVYAVSDRGILYCVRAESGLLRWQIPIADPGDDSFPVVHAETREGLGPVVVTQARTVRLVDRKTGENLGEYKLAASAVASAAADDERIYVAQVNQRYAAYRRKDGQISWTHTADAPIHMAPILRNNYIMFTNDSGRIYMFSVSDRSSIWGVKLDANLVEPVFMNEQDLFFVCKDYRLYSVDTGIGAENNAYRWRFRLNGAVSRGPVVADDMIFQIDPIDGMIALQRASGEPIWKIRDAHYFLGRSRSKAYLFNDNEETLLAIDGKSGKKMAAVPVRGASFYPANLQTDAIFFADKLGKIACVREQGAIKLTADAFITTRPTTMPAGSQTPVTPPSDAKSADNKQSGLTAPSDPLNADGK